MADRTDLPHAGLSRRAALKSLAIAAGGLALPLLAACGQAPAQQAAPSAAAKPTEAPKPAAQPTSAAAQPTSAPAPQAAPGKAGGPTTVKVLSWFWAEKGRDAALREAVTKYHAAQNDVRIQEVSVPFSDFFQRVTTSLAGGKLDADIVTLTAELQVRLMNGKFLDPVDGIVQKLGIKDKLAPMHDFATREGKLYGLLAVAAPYGLIYNKEIFEKGGFSGPPTTREELFATAKALTKRPDQFGYAGRSTMQEQSGWWSDLCHFVLSYDGQWVKDKKPTVNQPAVINAVRDYKRLYDDAIPQGADASTYRRMAWEGKIAQFMDNSTNINTIRSGNADTYTKIYSAAPPWENHRAVLNPNFFVLYQGSPNKDAAAAWLEFLYRPENLAPYMQASLDIYAPYSGLPIEQYLGGLHWVNGFLQAKGTSEVAMVHGLEGNIAEVRQIVLSKVSEVIQTNRAPEDAMAEAQTQLEELAARA